MPDGQRIVDDKNIYLWIVPAVVGGAWRLNRADGTTAALRFEQRFQRLVGDAGGQPLDAALRGDRLFFRLGGRDHHGIVGDRTLSPDPAHPDGAQGWRAERID
jgi:hypothetical protein